VRLSGDNRILILLLFPGLILLGFVLEVEVLDPSVAHRSPADEVAYWEAHVARNRDYPSSRVRLGIAYQKVNRLDDALKSFEAALGLDPDSEPAAIGRYGVLVQKGDREQALSGLVAYTDGHPDCVACWHDLAGEYLRQGRLDDAERAARTLLASHLMVTSGMYSATDLHYEALVIAGRIYAARGEHERAIELFRDATRRDPDNVRGYILQAKSFVASKHPDQARTVLAQAERVLEPGDSASREEVARLRAKALRMSARR
jgi:tetratricopeptide (TPR) repeat protein